MYIGLGIVLLVAGLILALDVITADLKYINEDALGTIFIVAGIIAIVISLIYTPPWRRDVFVRRGDDPPIDPRV